MEHGLWCRAAERYDPSYRNIGNPELIEKRTTRQVPVPPGGTLSDYVPFYFTSRSPMLMNIKSGWRGLPRVPMPDIVILVTSLRRIAEERIPFVFTDRHAYLLAAEFFDDIARLDRIAWDILRRSDFRSDDNDPGKLERYQAEALVHRHLPVPALSGMISLGAVQATHLRTLVSRAGHATPVIAKPEYFF